MFLTYGLCIIGACMYILPKSKEGNPGIKNNGIFHSAMHNRGWLGILTGTFLIVFYILLYYYPEYMQTWIIMVDPISQALKGTDGGRFFLYGFIYTLCIIVMGVRMIIKYRHSKYQIVRTFSVMLQKAIELDGDLKEKAVKDLEFMSVQDAVTAATR